MLSRGLGALLVLVLGLYLTTAAPLQTAGPDRYKQPVVEGTHLLVTCNVTVTPDIDVYWTRNVSSMPSFRQNGTDLSIHNITRSFSGDYVCHAVNTSDVSENGTDVNNTRVVEVVTVDVQYPAVFTMIPTEQIAFVNDTVSYTCFFDANPAAELTLYNNETGHAYATFTADSGSIQIGPMKATCKEGGLYVCTGYNYLNYGVNTTSTSNLTVMCKPQHDPQAGGRLHQKQASLGESGVYFEIDYVGYPPPSIVWAHNAKVVPLDMQRNTHNESIVTFTDIAVEDYGVYTVTLHNKLGFYTDVYELQSQIGKPQTPTNLEFYNVTYDSVTLRWTSGFDMGSPQYFIIINKDTRTQLSLRIPDSSPNHGVGQNWTRTVQGLAGDTYYRVSVFSQNYANYYSDDATPVHFWTKHNPYSQDSRSTVGAIVGGSVGGLALIGLLAFAVYFFKYRGMRTKYEKY